MNYKTSTNTTITRDLTTFDKATGNIYESVAIISKRANQISSEIKEELSGKLAEFASTVDNLEEIFENKEQIEVSKHYEKLPKATLIAVEEFMSEKVYHRNPLREP